MGAKLILEKLPLEPNDILLVIVSELVTPNDLDALKKVFDEKVKPRLPHANEILVLPFGMAIQALRPLTGQFKIINERLTVCKKENL